MPYKTLLVTGANNHDWKRTAPFLKGLLENSSNFQVEMAESASKALEADLSAYDLFLLDYNGPEWSEAAKSNFIDAVKAGAGVVVYHAANNPFKGWVDYETMAGMMWREGTGHGEFHEFTVTIVDSEHPITRGVSNFTTEDELYHRLVPMHGVQMQVLATAYSSLESRGTGEQEPILMTNNHGKGRIFHTVLGHVWPGEGDSYRGASLVAVENHGFQVTMLRGCEWAARKN